MFYLQEEREEEALADELQGATHQLGHVRLDRERLAMVFLPLSHTHTYAHTHTYTHIHTYSLSLSLTHTV